jgi:4-hydroxy-4-methyl-2-oxoglutarate aldolase
MRDVKESPSSHQQNRSLTPELIVQLSGLPVALIYDAQNHQGALDPAIRPLEMACKLCGPALTVYCPAGDNLTIHYAISQARPGDVLVVAQSQPDDGSWIYPPALFGDILMHAAQHRGIAGVIIDGFIRDVDQLVRGEIPVYARGASIIRPTKQKWGTVNQPIKLGPSVISPGDLILGDSDGLVCVSIDSAPSVLDHTQQLRQQEQALIAGIADGMTTVELLGLTETLSALGAL